VEVARHAPEVGLAENSWRSDTGGVERRTAAEEIIVRVMP